MIRLSRKVIDVMKDWFAERLLQAKLLPRRARTFIWLTLIIFYGISMIFLLWSGWQNWHQILPLLEGAKYSLIVYSIIWYVLCLAVSILLWLLIVRTFDNCRTSVWKNIQIYAITFSARRLPGTIWHVGGRIWFYQNIGISKSVIFLASLLEFVVGYITAGIVGLSFFFIIDIKIPFYITGIIFALIIGGAILVFPDIYSKLTKSVTVNSRISATIFDWLAWIISALAMWILGGMMVVQIIKILQPNLNTNNILYIVGAWALSGLAGLLTYFLPSSFGATEFSLTIFLSQILPLPLSGAVAIAVRIFTLAMDILFSMIFYPFFSHELLKSSMASNKVNTTDVYNSRVSKNTFDNNEE